MSGITYLRENIVYKIFVVIMKAAFAYKFGPIPTFGDGEVDLVSDGIKMRFPKELAKKLKMGAGTDVKEAMKTVAWFAVLGPAAIAMEKGKPVTIPYTQVESVGLTEVRYGVFGKKKFIKLTLAGEGKKIDIVFAPFTGTVKRNFVSEEFYEELRKKIGRKTRVKKEKKVMKRVEKPKKKAKKKYVKRVVVEEEPEEEAEEEFEEEEFEEEAMAEEPEIEEEEEEVEEKPIPKKRRAGPMKIRFCPGCGGEIKSLYNFCPYCGYDLRPLLET